MNRGRGGAGSAMAWFGGRLATGLQDVTSDPAALDSHGFWAVVATFEGDLTCARFADVRAAPPPSGRWHGPDTASWTTSLDERAYVAAVEAVRRAIAAGDVYQVNVCRVLSAPLPDPAQAQPAGLLAALVEGNPAPYAGLVDLPGRLRVVSASPELYLRRDDRIVESMPIKGTGATAADLRDKDVAENVMIVDLVRNDLGQVCEPGTVTVPSLCAVEQHPGLVHLVSAVRGELRPGVGWAQLFAATFPPGSVTGAPKSSALRIIRELEPVPRGPYCGAVGWVDADRGVGALAVGIRTFWWDEAPASSAGSLHFGTGAGITWGSVATDEWQETELKARRLLAVARGGTPPVS